MQASLDNSPRLCVPGFGLPVDTLSRWSRYRPRDRLPHAISDWLPSCGITLRERRMLDFIGQVTDKEDWVRKVFDEEIIAKWRAEGVRWDASLPEAGDWWLSDNMFQVCIQELQEKARAYEETGMVAVLDAEATIVKSDCAVSKELHDLLKEAVRPLEDVPEKLQDWHPGSDRKVLDLVHPSLYPLVYGVSKVMPMGAVPLQNCISYSGMGEQTGNFSALRTVGGRNINGWSTFQWLPSQIHFTDDGQASIVSYVNNLHPGQHANLYSVLERFVDVVIPLWNECISWYHKRTRISVRPTEDEDYTYPEGVDFPRDIYKKRAMDDPETYQPPDVEPAEEADWDDEEWAAEWACEDEYEEWKVENRILVQKEPVYVPQQDTKNRAGAQPIDLKKDFGQQGLQIIFKLANIHLTPDQPKYDGGTWHIEGSLNEHICATTLFYYDCDNVTESRLAFRQSIDTEEVSDKIGPNEIDSVCAYYGIERNGSAIMDLGSVLTRQYRLLAFPNILQHCVQPFELIDKKRPGHRKILAMFLVDPHISILSTANVPPQSKAWWSQEVRKAAPFDALPEELFNMIIDRVEDFPMAWEQAVNVRESLMAERSAVDEGVSAEMRQYHFNFCEH